MRRVGMLWPNVRVDCRIIPGAFVAAEISKPPSDAKAAPFHATALSAATSGGVDAEAGRPGHGDLGASPSVWSACASAQTTTPGGTSKDMTEEPTSGNVIIMTLWRASE